MPHWKTEHDQKENKKRVETSSSQQCVYFDNFTPDMPIDSYIVAGSTNAFGVNPNMTQITRQTHSKKQEFHKTYRVSLLGDSCIVTVINNALEMMESRQPNDKKKEGQGIM